MIQTKRAYDPPAKSDGPRFLVDRLWPRGLKKETLQLTAWHKDAAPSNHLRQWFNHDPAKWPEFKKRYRAELTAHPQTWQPLLAAAKKGKLTLLYSAHDTIHNNAIVLRPPQQKTKTLAALHHGKVIHRRCLSNQARVNRKS